MYFLSVYVNADFISKKIKAQFYSWCLGAKYQGKQILEPEGNRRMGNIAQRRVIISHLNQRV
jgi:hypothetical protein